jgi:hypothetical protein
MISFSPVVQGICANPSVSSFYLVRVASFYFTNYFKNVDFGGDTYVADGYLKDVDLPQLGSIVDRQQFKITFSDASLDFGVHANNNLVGKIAKIYVVFLDDVTNQPRLEPENVLVSNDSAVDGVSYSINTASVGEALFTVTCSSPMMDLDASAPFYTSADFYNKNYPGDTCCEQIYEGSSMISLRWGKQ